MLFTLFLDLKENSIFVFFKHIFKWEGKNGQD